MISAPQANGKAFFGLAGVSALLLILVIIGYATSKWIIYDFSAMLFGGAAFGMGPWGMPGMRRFDDSDNEYEYGLFYSCQNIFGSEVCMSEIAVASSFYAVQRPCMFWCAQLRAAQAFAIIAGIAFLAATALYAVAGSKNGKPLAIAAGATALVGGITALITIGLFSDIRYRMMPFFLSPITNDWGYGYGWVLTLIAGCIGTIIGVVGLIMAMRAGGETPRGPAKPTRVPVVPVHHYHQETTVVQPAPAAYSHHHHPLQHHGHTTHHAHSTSHHHRSRSPSPSGDPKLRSSAKKPQGETRRGSASSMSSV